MTDNNFQGAEPVGQIVFDDAGNTISSWGYNPSVFVVVPGSHFAVTLVQSMAAPTFNQRAISIDLALPSGTLPTLQAQHWISGSPDYTDDVAILDAAGAALAPLPAGSRVTVTAYRSAISQ